MDSSRIVVFCSCCSCCSRCKCRRFSPLLSDGLSLARLAYFSSCMYTRKRSPASHHPALSVEYNNRLGVQAADVSTQVPDTQRGRLARPGRYVGTRATRRSSRKGIRGSCRLIRLCYARTWCSKGSRYPIYLELRRGAGRLPESVERVQRLLEERVRLLPAHRTARSALALRTATAQAVVA